MRTLADIVFPSFYFYKIKFPNEREFEEVEFQRNLKQFADTCSNPLVALAAVNNTDIEHFFDDNKTFYFDFLNRLKKELPKSGYTQNFEKKLNYLAGYQPSDNSGFKILSLCLLLALFFAAYYIWILRAKLTALKDQSTKIAMPAKVAPSLTKKEEEILEFIKTGKSNKEIASELFIELSTVKTHINKIYSKLGIKNRKEAKSYFEEQSS
jgi:DNA-binding CsgD family transcriptional regulator